MISAYLRAGQDVFPVHRLHSIYHLSNLIFFLLRHKCYRIYVFFFWKSCMGKMNDQIRTVLALVNVNVDENIAVHFLGGTWFSSLEVKLLKSISQQLENFAPWYFKKVESLFVYNSLHFRHSPSTRPPALHPSVRLPYIRPSAYHPPICLPFVHPSPYRSPVLNLPSFHLCGHPSVHSSVFQFLYHPFTRQLPWCIYNYVLEDPPLM